MKINKLKKHTGKQKIKAKKIKKQKSTNNKTKVKSAIKQKTQFKYFTNKKDNKNFNQLRDTAKKSLDKRRNKGNDNKKPDGGNIIFDNILDDFITKLSEPVSSYRQGARTIRRRSAEDIAASERAKTTLLNLTLRVVETDGKSVVGWRLNKADPQRIMDLCAIVLYGYAEEVNARTHELATIIKGRKLTLSEMLDLSEQSEINEGW